LKITIELKESARKLDASRLSDLEFEALKAVLHGHAESDQVAVLQARIDAHSADVAAAGLDLGREPEIDDGGDADLLRTVGRVCDFKKLTSEQSGIYFRAKESVRSGNGVALDLADRAALILMIPEPA
jgi:hypothetical protein